MMTNEFKLRKYTDLSPRKDRARFSYVSAASLPPYEDDGDDDYSTDKRSTGLPTELDLLIAQTSSILLASNDCLNNTIEARERLRHFYAMDEMLERTLTLQESLIRQRTSNIRRWDRRINNLSNDIHERLDILGIPKVSSASAPPSLLTLKPKSPRESLEDTAHHDKDGVPASLLSTPVAVVSSSDVKLDDLPSQSTPPSSFAKNLYSSIFASSSISTPPVARDLLTRLASSPSSPSSPSLDETRSNVTMSEVSVHTPRDLQSDTMMKKGLLCPYTAAPATSSLSFLDQAYSSDIKEFDEMAGLTKVRPAQHYRKNSGTEILNGVDVPNSASAQSTPRAEKLNVKGSSSTPDKEETRKRTLTAQEQLLSIMVTGKCKR